MKHLHLDPVGGIAGDMFVAALLHAAPEHFPAVEAAVRALAGVSCAVAPHETGPLRGLRFVADEPAHHHHHHHHHDHGHAHWREIRARIEDSALSPGARGHAIGIFTHLAEAEARVHGVGIDEVAFHEVGAVDSIADIAAAAVLIDAIGPARWSVGPLPLGGGRVRTAHGVMPVPAPATALLMEGFDTIDDGIPGERVTPTGAAILRHLGCGARSGGVMGATGLGFGTRSLPDLANCLRVLVLENGADDRPDPAHRTLAVIAFEVDDQPAEDLAAGLDRLRALLGIHDVLQMPAFGKKGRMATHVQVLASPEATQAAVEACFRETTTIGLRVGSVEGRTLARRSVDVTVDGRTMRVKQVDRPGGRTGKAESDDVLHAESQAARSRLRRLAETQADESA